MRLYCKLALLVLVACATQATLSNDVLGETYFEARCYVANMTGNREMESRLMAEAQHRLMSQQPHFGPVTVVAYHWDESQ